MTFLNSLSRSFSISSFCDSKMEKVFGSFARKQWFPCLYCSWSFCLPRPLPSDLCVFSNNFCLSVVSVTPQFVGRFCSSRSQSGMMPGLSCWLLHRLSLSLHRQCRVGSASACTVSADPVASLLALAVRGCAQAFICLA